MLELTENNFLYFYSTIAQVFGAILGLIGLTYVQRKEDVESNVNEYVNSLFHHLKEAANELKEKKQKPENRAPSFTLNSENVRDFLQPWREYLSDRTYESCMEAAGCAERQTEIMESVSKKFRWICYQLVVLVIFGILGLCVPYNKTELYHIVILFLIVCLSIVALINSGRFFLKVDDTDKQVVRTI